MDFLYMLDSKLRFVEFFYSAASKCFQAEMDKIERHEVPYDTFDPENGDPPFVDEYIEFGDGLRTLGNLTLSLVSVVLQEYLAASTDQLGLGQPPKIKEKGIFQRYRQLILEKTEVDIAKLGADCALIEEIFLARNRIQHVGDIGTKWVYQDKEYARKYPKAEFANRSWIEAMGDETDPEIIAAPLEITGEKIGKAIAEVKKLCAAIEIEFQKLPGYW
ncbi:MAG TPA: hypothetical protein VE263_03900 [Candidatus Angelobacter sp.]|nr:hypothetical protein [Candidatus Angelobacter sp.]